MEVSGTQGKFSILQLLFTISLAGIRTKQILRETADLKTRDVVRRDLRVCLNNRGFPSFPRRALVIMPHMERSKIVFFPPH